MHWQLSQRSEFGTLRPVLGCWLLKRRRGMRARAYYQEVYMINKKEIIAKFARNEKDTGSSEIQVALLTERINHLTQHLKEHPKDFHSRRGLLKMVGQRKGLLNYIKQKDIVKYRGLIAELGLRK
jgi:small subunit ribosomal protein S15